MSKHSVAKKTGSVATALGKGIIAGLAGTAAITISQMIEMQLTGRKTSDAPVKAAEKVLDVKPASKEDKEKMAQEVHWSYGTSWGVVRSLISATGMTGLPGEPGTLCRPVGYRPGYGAIAENCPAHHRVAAESSSH